jgi:hypothetical protein
LVAAIGVIASLIYLAIQIRQNTRSVRMASHHSISAGLHELSKTIANDPKMAELWRKGTRDLNCLSDDDRIRFELLAGWLFRSYEELHAYHDRGLIESNFWASRSRNMLAFISLPGIRQWWDTTLITFPTTGAEQFTHEFRNYVAPRLSKEWKIPGESQQSGVAP